MSRLFRVFVPVSVIGLIVSEVVFLFLCYIAGASLLNRFINSEFELSIFLRDDYGFFRIAVVVICIIAGLYFQDLYSSVGVKSMSVLIQQLCLVCGFAFLIQALFAYAKKPEWSVPRWAMIFGSIFVIVVIPAWRFFYGNVIVKALANQRILFLGTSPVIQEIAAHLVSHPEAGVRVLGYIDSGDPARELPGGAVLGCVDNLRRIAEELKPDMIIVGLTERRQEMPMADMLHLRFQGVRFEEADVAFEATFGRVLTRQIRLSQLIFSANLGPRKNSVFWHSAYSTIIAVALSIVAAPVMLVLAIIVKLTSAGPVLHRQVRVGLNDKTFTLYKFRSMYANAEAGTGAVWAQRNDPRVTKPGRWMRRLRLDELPQLLNVLRGDMSLVGPRPERPEFVTSLEKQIPYYSYRHCVKPGITGWAQINYKYGDTLSDAIMKFEYDLYYIKNLAVSLDMFILFHTLKVMLFSETAQ